MSTSPDPPLALELTDVTKQYGALRPLRIRSLAIRRGERVAITGVDGPAAEVFVNLVTGAALPDEGRVAVFGKSTAEIPDGDAWLASLDRFGIVSPRAVLLEGATLAQNLAMPFTLAIDPIPADVRATVERLAEECGLPPASLESRAGEMSPALLARVHVARAIALGPALLLLEHPTAAVPEAERQAFAADVARICEARSQTLVAVTMDREFAGAAAERALALQPATGVLKPLERRRWFW
jgi:ABC-type lipoprotein export system ATPase subunit